MGFMRVAAEVLDLIGRNFGAEHLGYVDSPNDEP